MNSSIKKTLMKQKRFAFSEGFTLIELLVVVAIIMTLVSLMLPALKNAREMSKRLKCMANLKQIGYAFTTYSDENDGMLPGMINNAPASNHLWYRAQILGGYLVQGATVNSQFIRYLTCPTDLSPSASYGSYASNNRLTGAGNTCLSVSSILKPEQKILLMDTGWPMNRTGTVNEIMGGNAAYISNRHGGQGSATTAGGCNVLFCDFHVTFYNYDPNRLMGSNVIDFPCHATGGPCMWQYNQ